MEKNHLVFFFSFGTNCYTNLIYIKRIGSYSVGNWYVKFKIFKVNVPLYLLDMFGHLDIGYHCDSQRFIVTSQEPVGVVPCRCQLSHARWTLGRSHTPSVMMLPCLGTWFFSVTPAFGKQSDLSSHYVVCLPACLVSWLLVCGHDFKT